MTSACYTRSAYYTWCDHPAQRTVEFYPDATAAIQAGLRRAARPHESQSRPAEPAGPGNSTLTRSAG